MDPNLVKFLEEDEDETMHSGADVEAFTAALNRDIEGNSSTSSQHHSDIDGVAVSHESSQNASQFHSQWQISSHDGIITSQSGQDLMIMEQKDDSLSKPELQQHGSESLDIKEEDGSSHELNTLPFRHNPSIDACPDPQDIKNPFTVSEPTTIQTSGEEPVLIQNSDHGIKSEIETQMHKLQNMSDQLSMEIGADNQQSVAIESNDQKPLSAGIGNQQTNMGISNDQAMATLNQHTGGMGMGSQQSTFSGMSNQLSMTGSNQLSMTGSNQQSSASSKLNKQVPFGMLLPIIQPQLDKDRAMQLNTLYIKLKKNEISKDGFVKNMRSIVGDQMLKMAVYKLQTQAAKNGQPSTQFQSMSQAAARQFQGSSSAQMTPDFTNSNTDGSTMKSREAESQQDSQGARVGQLSSSSLNALSQERRHPALSAQGVNKQHQMHFSQTSFPTYGSSGSSYSPFSATNVASSTSFRPQLHDSQARPASAHQNMASSHLGPNTQAINMTNMSKFERPHSLSDPKKMQPGTLTHMNSNMTMQQNPVQWPSSTSQEHYVKQEPVDQSNEQQKAQFSSPQGLTSLAHIKHGDAAPGNLRDESFEVHPRTGSTPSLNMSNSRMPSLTSPIGPSKAIPKKPLVGQKKPMDAPGSSPPPSSKKQKVSGGFADQSIEQLNDVTAVSGVNLREEEEQLFSGSKEDSRVSEASRRVVQEEEERLILHKIPLQKKVVEIMAKSGLKSMSNDVERCLSLCVEERMRGLIANLIRLSKQRVDIEKPRHKTIITSDIRQQIMKLNRKAREEWEKKQAETEKSQKPIEPDGGAGTDGDKDKDESRRSAKVNKEEDDKMRATAANVAVRAATGVGDMLSRWQLMIEAKKQGGTDASSGSQPTKDVTQKSLPTSTRTTRESQESEKRDRPAASNNPGLVRKVGRNQVVVPRVARSITVKDVIAVLEREPQMSRSTLIYRLYDKARADTAAE